MKNARFSFDRLGLRPEPVLMKKFALAAALSLFALPALAAPSPTALVFLGYGQSLMQAPVAGDQLVMTGCSSSGSVLTISGYGGSAITVGSVLDYGQAPLNPPLTISSFGTGTGGNGTYNLSTTPANAPPGTCTIAPGGTGGPATLITPSNVNANAFMINAGQGSPRGWYDTLTYSNQSTNKPVAIGLWSGFTQLKEAVTLYNIGNGSGGINTESPMSSFVAQYIAATGIALPNAVIAENLAVGGLDWFGSPGNAHLGPGGPLEWTNVVTAQKYIKNQLQGSASALSGTGFPSNAGPWNYRLGGVALRHGEAAAASGIAINVNGTTITSGVTTSITVTGANGYVPASLPNGWCVVDHTASNALLGYVASWGSTTLTLAAPAAVSGSGTTDSLYISPCYPGYQAELRSMLAQFAASDVSDAPTPGGPPIIAQIPSTTNWSNNGVSERVFAHFVNAAFATVGLADRRMVVAGPNFECGPYQSDAVHGSPRHNAMCGAYMGKWAAWNALGYRTAPFTMISAQWVAPGTTCGGQSTNYCIRVTFQMPPSPAQNGATAAQQQTLQLYSDTNVTSLTNYGFCYMDGTIPGGGATFFNWAGGTGGCAGSSSGTTINSVALTAGATNQIDIVTSATTLTAINSAGNPTIGLGMAWQPGSASLFGFTNGYFFFHNVAAKDCTKVANAGLSGNAFPNTICNGGSGGSNYLIDFADPGFIGVGQTLTTAW